MDATTLYRRRQRRRALIAWATFLLVAALVAVGIAFGGDDGGGQRHPGTIFVSKMSAGQYEALHEGEGGMAVLKALGSTGLPEDELIETEVPRLFPPPPPGASCSFWTLSDAPDHHVRLCFSDRDGILLQKAVRAPGEGGAETTLA